MKKILAVTLMLCIFTAMAIGTAAAKPNVDLYTKQSQYANACGLGPKACASQISGAAVCETCYKTTVIAGAAQTATASACAGSASVGNCQTVCLQICA